MTKTPATKRFDEGTKVRREVLGDAHVDRARSAESDFDAPFQTLITEGAWGTVWASDALTRRERSLVTLALLAGLGNLEEFALHVRATARTGASAADVREALMHVAVYAGVPRANSALKVAKGVYAEIAAETATETGAEAGSETGADAGVEAGNDAEAEARVEMEP